jgi:hypothetical protein
MGQETFRPPGSTWQIVVPSGWRVADQAQLEEVTRGANQLAEAIPGAPKVSYVLMLVPNEADGRSVLVQAKLALPAGLDFAGAAVPIMDSMKKTLGTIDASGAAGVNSDSMRADFETKRVFVRATIVTDTSESFASVTVLHFGAFQTVSVTAAAPEAQFAREGESIYREIAEGIAFDPGKEYVFASRSPNQQLGEMLYLGLGAALLVGVIVARKNRKARRDESVHTSQAG